MKIGKAESLIKEQNSANDRDWSLMIYDSYRPASVSQKVSQEFDGMITPGSDNYNADIYNGISGWCSPLNADADDCKTFFLSTNVSSHNQGAAVDVSLWDNNAGSEVAGSPTTVHELSEEAARCNKLTNSSGVNNCTFSTGMSGSQMAQYLSTVMTNENVGMRPISSEWWHFQDDNTLDSMNDKTSTTGRNFQVTSIVSTYGYPTSFNELKGDVNADGIVDVSDAELIYNTYELLGECDTCDDIKSQADYNQDGSVNLDDVYDILNRNNDLLTSNYYTIGDDYILIGVGTFDSNKIEFNGSGDTGVTYTFNGDNQQLSIKLNGKEVKTYVVISYYTSKHNLNESYILYSGGESQIESEKTAGTILCRNCFVDYNLNDAKVYIRRSSDAVDYLAAYDMIYYQYPEHDLTNPYIYIGKNTELVSFSNDIINGTFRCVNCDTVMASDGVYKVYIIKEMEDDPQFNINDLSPDDIYAQFDLVSYGSNDYVLGESINLNDNTITDLMNKISCTNCDINVYNGSTKITSGTIPSGSRVIVTESVSGDGDEVASSIVNYPVTGVSITSETLNLAINKRKSLNYEITPSYATNQNVTWSSSDESVATVDSNGLVTAVGAGEAIITVTTEDRGYTDTCSVVVSESVAYNVTFKDGDTVIKTVAYEEDELVDLSLWEKIPDEYSIDKRFTGWLYDSNGDGTKELYNSNNPLSMPASDIELTKKKKKGNYAIQNSTTSSEKFITGIKSNTNVDNLNFEHGSEITYAIYKGDLLKNSGNIGTGDTLKIYSNGSLIESYTVVIRGDNDGDGLISVNDVSMIYSHIKGKFNFNNIQFMASDVDGDDLISVNDVSMIYSHIKRKINLDVFN